MRSSPAESARVSEASNEIAEIRPRPELAGAAEIGGIERGLRGPFQETAPPLGGGGGVEGALPNPPPEPADAGPQAAPCPAKMRPISSATSSETRSRTRASAPRSRSRAPD